MDDDYGATFFPTMEEHNRQRRRRVDRNYELKILRKLLRAWYTPEQIKVLELKEQDEFDWHWFNRTGLCSANVFTARIPNVQVRPLFESKRLPSTDVWKMFRRFGKYCDGDPVAVVFPITAMGNYVVTDAVGIPAVPWANILTRRGKREGSQMTIRHLNAFIKGLEEMNKSPADNPIE